jgi:hypothetical protein
MYGEASSSKLKFNFGENTTFVKITDIVSIVEKDLLAYI